MDENKKRGDLLSKLFERIMQTIADTDAFSKSDSPNFFLVYAHNNVSVGEAGADIALQLITGLKALRTKVLSDRSLSLEPWYTREDNHAVQDVVSNQFCLLPQSIYKAGDDCSIGSVDKVILCCSEVLKSYYQDKLMKTYIKAIKDSYFQQAAGNIDEFKELVEEIVKQYRNKEGFHHVVTELAFLEIRVSEEKRNHGIIPLVLSGDDIEFLPFLDDGNPLWLKPQKPESTIHECQISHRLVFKILRQIYTDQHTLIDEFENCYRRCVKDVSPGSSLPSQSRFEGVISTELKRSTDRLIGLQTAAIRTVPDGTKFRVPFDLTGLPTTSNFMGRKADLALIKEQLRPGEVSDRRKICVIHGMGGIGKTQLAIEYARSHKTRYKSFFWLNGKTEESLIQSLLLLEPRLPELQKERVGQEVKGLEESRERARKILRWFNLGDNTQWLLIYDNIDRTSYGDSDNDSLPTYDITQYFPKGDAGAIIITTRLQRLVSLGTQVHLQKLDVLESLSILENHAGPKLKQTDGDWHPDAIALVERLGNLPLALVFAGSYIAKTTVSKYLKLYEESWKELQDATKDREDYQNGTIVTTWLISFDELRTKAEDAAKLLQLWSFLDNQDVWFELLRWPSLETAPRWLQNITATEIGFIDTMGILLDYSLIERDDNGSYSMHAVVHDWIRASFIQQDNASLFLVATATIEYAIPSPPKEGSWVERLRLLPHVFRWSQCYTEFQHILIESEWLDSLDKIGEFLEHNLNFDMAELLYKQVLTVNEQVNGLEQEKALLAAQKLERLFHNNFRHTDAKTMLSRALNGFENILGPLHIPTLLAAYRLADSYRETYQLDEAKGLYTQVPTGREKAFDPEDRMTVRILRRLGTIYFELGQFTEARALYDRAMKVYNKRPNSELISDLAVASARGATLATSGRIAEARTVLIRAWELGEEIAGLKFLTALPAAYILGSINLAENKFTEAIISFNYVRMVFELIRGPDSIDTGAVLVQVGALYFEQNQLTEGETMFVRALAVGEKNFGSDGQETLMVARILAHLYEFQGRDSEAHDIYERFQELEKLETTPEYSTKGNFWDVLGRRCHMNLWSEFWKY